MKRKIGMFAGLVGASLLASQAMAAFTPPVGNDELKLIDGSGFYAPTNGTTTAGTPLGRSDAFPAGTLHNKTAPGELAALNTPVASGGIIGAQDYTAFNITSLLVDGSTVNLPAGVTVTGVSTFLKIVNVDSSAPSGVGNLTVQIGDDSVGHGNTPAVDPAGGITIGRFFLFDGSTPPLGVTPGSFSASGGNASNVTFNNGTVTDGVNTYAIDTLPNFTDGTLLLTGSFIATNNLNDVSTAGSGPIDLLDDTLNSSTDLGVSWSGGIGTTSIVVDGGQWFQDGIIPATGASFQINQIGFDGTSNPTPAHGDPGVYAGGWQVSSQDPVAFTISHPGIPEPITAGLGTLALASLAGYSTRRRRMA